MNPMLHVYYINLRNGTVYQKIAKPLSGGSIDADQFEIHLQDCGQIVDLSSATVIGAVYRPDNSVVPLTAVVAKDDAVLITLDKYCYAIPGMITLKVKIADEGILRTALSISMTVDEPDSAVIINNETLGTLSELVEAINSMDTAAAEAQQVVDQAREDLLTTTEEANTSMQATKDAANASMQATETAANASMQETKDAATATMEETASTANQSMAEVSDTAVSSIKAAEDNAKAVLDKSASDLAGYVTRTEDAEAGAKAAQSAAEASARSAKASAERASRVATGVANSVNLVAKKAEEAQQSAKEAFNQALNASFDATQAYTHASAAEHSANAAEASRQAAQAVLESIPHDYSNLSKMADGVAIIAEASGAIISVHDGAVVDAVSLVSHIAPASDGSGWNAVNVHRTGKNLLSKTTNDVEEITYTKTDGSSSTLYGYHVHLPAGDYQVRGSYKEGYSSGVFVSGIVLDAAGVVSQSAFAVVNNSGGKTVDLTLGDSESLILYNVLTNDGVSGTVTKFKKVNLGIYIADNDTEYEEYVGVTLTAELPETVYGGTLDWVKGVLTSTLDSAGNALHTPKEYLLTPQQLEMLYGCNAVWSDCGDTAVSYVVDTKTYVDEHAVGGDGGSVASVNGKTGAVVLNAADVGAMPADAKIVDDDAREQIAALSEEIGELKENGGSGGDSSAYFETVHIPGKNLLNLETMEAGYITPAGAVASSNTSYKTSDYIAVDAGDILAGSWIPADTQMQTAMKMRYVANYTAGKVFISTVDNNADTYTVPENTAYIRVSLYTNTYKTQQLQIEKTDNSVFSEYEEYGDKEIVQLKPAIVVPEVAQARGEYSDLNTRLNAMSTASSCLNLPAKLYALVGEELNVYFDNILAEGRDTDYEWDVTCAVGQHMARGYVLTAEEAGEYPITISATKNGNTVMAESTIIVSVAEQGNGVTRSFLILGDSTTNNSKLTEKITENFAGDGMNITLLGTRGEAPNSHEGRAGWTLALYHTKAEHNGVANPFYNPSSGAFDASYYFANTGVAVPDYFVINLGINDMFGFADDATAETGIATALGLLDDTIASVRAAAPNTKICVALTIPPNYSQDAFGKAYKCNQTRDRYKRNNALWVSKLIEMYQGRETEGIYLLPINTNLDTRFNMGFEVAQVNKRNSETYQQPIGNGGVHPVESGYWQIADVYWYFIKSFEA